MPRAKVVIKNKLQFHLMQTELIMAVCRVRAYGTTRKKHRYTLHGWMDGGPYSQFFDALMRHLWKWWYRNEVDSDSGLSHLWHAAFNLGCLITYQMRGYTKYDDRPTNVPEPEQLELLFDN